MPYESDPNHSVTTWLGQLKDDESAAASALWQRYLERLVLLAKRKMGDSPKRSADEEDVALSAFVGFLDGIRDGRFAQLNDRDDLWQILVMLTERKAIGLMRHEGAAKRGGGKLRGESVLSLPHDNTDGAQGLEQFDGGEPTPEFAAEFREQLESLLDQLDEPLMKQIALCKLEGYSNQETATRLDTSLRSVERKMGIIRRIWRRALKE